MKTVPTMIDEKFPDKGPIRSTVKFVAGMLMVLAIIGWMALWNIGDAEGATPQTSATVSTSSCWEYSGRGCGIEDPNPATPEWVFKCGGAAAIGGYYGWGGAATAGAGCLWMQVW